MRFKFLGAILSKDGRSDNDTGYKIILNNNNNTRESFAKADEFCALKGKITYITNKKIYSAIVESIRRHL